MTQFFSSAERSTAPGAVSRNWSQEPARPTIEKSWAGPDGGKAKNRFFGIPETRFFEKTRFLDRSYSWPLLKFHRAACSSQPVDEPTAMTDRR